MAVSLKGKKIEQTKKYGTNLKLHRTIKHQVQPSSEFRVCCFCGTPQR